MKCLGKTYKYNIGACQNNGAVDGYCYLHHPEVLLAKFRFQLRAARKPGPYDFALEELPRLIQEQQALLAEIAARPLQISPRMEAAVAVDPMPVPTGQLPVLAGHQPT